MAIREVKNIPFEDKPKTKAAQIREDVREAISKRMDSVEFIGDLYSDKGIAARIRELSWPLFRDYLIERANVKMKFSPCRNFRWLIDSGKIHTLYKVVWRKDENDQVHIYMAIDHELINKYAEELANESDGKYKCRNT